SLLSYVYFFFQAEDGIRDRNVTGVQTCALPISFISRTFPTVVRSVKFKISSQACPVVHCRPVNFPVVYRRNKVILGSLLQNKTRSEERRVGKEWRTRCAETQ